MASATKTTKSVKSAKSTKQYHVVKTICRVLSADMTKSGKQEIIQTRLYYKGGAWLSEQFKDGASKMSLERAKSIVINLDNDNFDETFDWLLA